MKYKLGFLVLFTVLLIGCTNDQHTWDSFSPPSAVHSTDPVERGCGYIAAAIFLSAILRAICNK